MAKTRKPAADLLTHIQYAFTHALPHIYRRGVDQSEEQTAPRKPLHGRLNRAVVHEDQAIFTVEVIT